MSTTGQVEEQVCTRCIMDTTVPGIRFDEKGECNFCELHDKMDRMYPMGAEGEKILGEMVDRIKRR